MIDELIEYMLFTIYANLNEFMLISLGIVSFSILAWIFGYVSFSCFTESEYNGSIFTYLGFIAPCLLFISFAIISLLICLCSGYIFVVLIVIPMTIFDARLDIEYSCWELLEQGD